MAACAGVGESARGTGSSHAHRQHPTALRPTPTPHPLTAPAPRAWPSAVEPPPFPHPSSPPCTGLRDCRRRLIRVVSSPPPAASAPRLYARLAAVLAAAFPTIGSQVAAIATAEFDELFGTEEEPQRGAAGGKGGGGRGMGGGGIGGGGDLPARVRNASFVGELTKFGLMAGHAVLERIRRCIDHFAVPQVKGGQGGEQHSRWKEVFGIIKRWGVAGPSGCCQ